MQAHSQSSPAARTSYRASLFPAVAQTADSVDVRSAKDTPSLAQSAGLAHDAGNLLGALGLYCDLLAAPGVLRPEHQHYVTELRQLAGRSGNLVRALLIATPGTPALAASGAPALAASTSPAPNAPNAAAILRAIEPLLCAIAGTAVTVVCKAPRALATPPLHPESLERILVNLVRNASQAIESVQPQRHGHIRIALATVSGHLRLTVEDNGPGMPVTTAAAFLSPSPLPKGARRGLGHRIVHELVTASGGRLHLRVRPGRGTTITVHWPVPVGAHPAHPSAAVAPGRLRVGATPC